ncbi:MAG: T9SS type A sorting domain-containing protein [Bacteroidota bacterium]|nr:T9SS type A sorting domain-containing protein [Bacteroidota bacterium]
MFSCSINDGAYRSSDNGNSWTEINNNLTNADSRKAYDMQFFSGKLYLATVDGIYISTNVGDNWERKSTGLTNGPGATSIFAFSISEIDGIFYTGTWNGIYYSTNAAESWDLSNVSGQGVRIVSFIKFNEELYAGRDAINPPALYKSVDAGLNWVSVNVWNNFPISVFCFYAEEDSIFIGTGHGMWISTNNGLNWTSRSTGLSLDPYVSSIVKSGNTMIASLRFGGSGIFRSSNNGLLWEDISDNLPFINDITKLIVHDNKVYAATSEKIWYRDLDEILTSIPSEINSPPGQLYLSQNYPNPFNPNTVITYQLAVTDYVSLKIYNNPGKEVASLINETQSAGNYKINFDGSNLPGGIYYYKLTAGDFINTRKMILLK